MNFLNTFTVEKFSKSQQKNLSLKNNFETYIYIYTHCNFSTCLNSRNSLTIFFRFYSKYYIIKYYRYTYFICERKKKFVSLSFS